MFPKLSFLRLNRILIILMLSSCHTFQPDRTEKSSGLMENLGNHQYKITTSVAATQRYFDQGLILSFGFNHAEAAQSFKLAYQEDPACAVCYWGIALVLGPNINAPMDPLVIPQAYSFVQKALEIAKSASNRERALITALSKRYQAEAVNDRTKLDQDYANAMRDVFRLFPDDAVIAALFAESLMDLHPWDFWTKQGEARPWTAEIVTTLERALHIDKENPLANHLYIHVLEASPYVSKAIPSAERLASLVPGSGHLVHMPAHIFIRTGRYRDAILANQLAVKIDHNYLSHEHEESIYTMAYVPHNHHFMWAAAIKIGRKALALRAAEETASYAAPEMMHEPGLSGTMQHFFAIPIYTHALFGDWEAILALVPPADDLLYAKAIWHYARGMAFLRLAQPVKASQELAQLKTIIADPDISELTIFDLNSISQILQVGSNLLQGEMAANANDFEQAIDFVKQAVSLEDELNYTEPKDWYLPPRQVLGAILLEAGKPEQAEQSYRQDLINHPQNGWSLWGLAKSLEQQGNLQQAAKVISQFKEVWGEADVKLNASRY